MSALPGSATPWSEGQMVQGPRGRHTRAGPAVAVRGLAGGSAHVQLQLADLLVQLVQVGFQADVLKS